MEWKPYGAATLVGSMPHRDRLQVISFILEKLKDVPCWPQLPTYQPEQMMNQYLEGLPGYNPETMGQNIIHTDSTSFDDELYGFYADYLDVIEGRANILESRFGLGVESGKTFKLFLEKLSHQGSGQYRAIKGQVVGPFTLLSSLKAPDGRLLLYDDRMIDVVPKHLALKALWQATLLGPFCERVIIFFDEPALAGFGSSAFIGISKEYVQRLLDELVDILKPHNVLVGVHVCANTDWSILLNSRINIINCDAYNYGDRFCLYIRDIERFLSEGGIVAWGIVPTDDPEKIVREDGISLYERLLKLLGQYFSDDGIKSLLAQSIITPSCGCGTLTEAMAERVVELAVDCSKRIESIFRG